MMMGRRNEEGDEEANEYKARFAKNWLFANRLGFLASRGCRVLIILVFVLLPLNEEMRVTFRQLNKVFRRNWIFLSVTLLVILCAAKVGPNTEKCL